MTDKTTPVVQPAKADALSEPFLPMSAWDRRDGTVLLLVDYSDGEHPLDDATTAITIGHNNDHNLGEGEGEGWKFAGWCWTHDHYVQGKGRPIGWAPLPHSLAALQSTEATENPDAKPVFAQRAADKWQRADDIDALLATPQSPTPASPSLEEVERVEIDRPFMLAAARAWWAVHMGGNVRAINITGDGRVKVAWSDADESGHYTLPVDFLTALSAPASATSERKEAWPLGDAFHVEYDDSDDDFTICWPDGRYLVAHRSGAIVTGQSPQSLGVAPVKTTIEALSRLDAIERGDAR